MQIEIWSDIVCPWCYLGKRRLEEALDRFEGRADVRVVHRAFQLDPTRPMGTTQNRRRMLMAKYGWTEAQAEAIDAQMMARAAEDGLSYRLTAEGVTGNTRLAHELVQMAGAEGRADEMLERLYKAYFSEERSIFDIDSLVALAAEVGLDPQAARAALEEGRYTAAVQADDRQAREFGASGVPLFVIDRRFGVSGAQPVEVFVEALTRGAETRSTVDSQQSTADTHRSMDRGL
jgi:predicted DsbA family dithiol-disulfide isomerase